MNIKIIASPSGDDILLKIDGYHSVILARHELQELKVAIEKWQGEQPFKVAKEATGKPDCIFFEAEPIGGDEEHTQWGYYCRAKDSYNDDIACEGCELYDDGEEEGGEE